MRSERLVAGLASGDNNNRLDSCINLFNSGNYLENVLCGVDPILSDNY